MVKKCTLSVLTAIVLVMATLFAACGKTEYTLYSYEFRDKTYEIGDTFYGVEITEALVVLTLKDEELELKISEAFLKGDSSKVGEYVTYTGTYTETDDAINALIPDFSSTPISATKVGNSLSIKISSSATIILKR